MLTRTLVNVATASVVVASSFAPSLKGLLHTAGRLHLEWHCATFLLGGVVIISGARRARDERVLALACIAFGCALEWLERRVYHTDRVEAADMIADAAGVVIGWMLLRLYRRVVLRQQARPSCCRS